MKPQKPTSNQLKFLSSMYEDETPLRGRIAILSAEQGSSSDTTNKIIIFLEHSQSIALFFLANYRAFGQTGAYDTHISTPMLYLSKLLGPGNLLIFNHEHVSQVYSVLIAAFCCFVLRVLLFVYVVYVAIRKKEGSKYSLAIWRLIFKVQSRILYFFMASLWINTAIACFKNQMELESGINSMISAFATIMIVLEFSFSIFLQTQFEGSLPSKSFLASKSNVTEIITLTQKFFNQIVRRSLFSAPILSTWLHNIFLVISSGARLKYYLHFLPSYRIDSLRYQVYFLVIVFCLNLACASQNVFQDYPVDLEFVMILWIGLSVLLMKYVLSYLDNRILKLALTNEIVTPEALFHRLIIVKYMFKKRRLPSSIADSIPVEHLLATTIKENLVKNLSIYSENMKTDGFDFQDKEKRNEFFTIYLENLLRKFPKNIQLRMYTAYYYAKKRKMYGLCIKTLSSLKNSSSWRVVVSTSILFEKIKTIIQRDYRVKNYLFDIDEFTRSTSFSAQLKINTAAQAQFQADLCQEITTGAGNLVQILKASQNAVRLKKRIEKETSKMFEWLPDSYLEPHMILAHYHLVLTHEYEKYLKYHQHYLKHIEKYEKIWKDPQFRTESLYQEDTGLLILSGENNRAGYLLYCGGNFDEIFGMNLAGTHLSTVTPPSLRFHSAQKIKMSIEQGAKTVVDHVQQQFFYNVRGYMTLVRYYLNFNAFMIHGLVYYLIYQPARDYKETILVDDGGYIESFTKGIGVRLGLLSKQRGAYKQGEKRISELNKEFERINLAIHLVTFPERKWKTESDIGNVDEAKEIHKMYTEKGAVLSLAKVNNSKKEYKYRCKISCVVLNNNLLKFITLDNVEGYETSSESESETEIETDFIAEEEDEKRNGWIDLSKLKQTTERNYEDSPNPTDLAFTIPVSSPRKLLTSTRHFSPDPDPDFENTHHQFPKTLVKMKSSEDEEENRVDVKKKAEKISLQEPEWLTSNRIQLSKAFERTLSRAYYPSFYRTFAFVLCGLFLIILILEALMHSSVNSSIPTMRNSKNILEIAETKTRLLAEINTYTLFLYNYATGSINISEYMSILAPKFFTGHIQSLLIQIENADANMLEVVSSLKSEDQEQFFESDVRMFETYFDEAEQVYSNMTIFQGVSLLTQSAFKAVPFFETKSTYPQAAPYLEFVIRNILNNILIKNQQFDESFQYNLEDKKDKTLNVFLAYSVALFVALILAILSCSYLAYLQYQSEKRNLISLLKLNKISVKNMRGHIESFQTLISRNVNFLMTLNEESAPYLLSSFKRKHEIQQNHHEADTTKQDLHFKQLKLSYYTLILKATFTIIMSILLVIGNLLQLQKAFSDIKLRADQLHFIDKLNSDMMLAASTYHTLVIAGNSALIENQALSIVIAEETEVLGKNINKITTTFHKDQSSKLLEAQEILFGDACAFLEDNSGHFGYCKELASNQEKAGLVNLLSNFELILSSFYSKYTAVADVTDHDTQVSLQLEVLDDIIFPVFLVTKPLCLLISDSLDQSLGDFMNQVVDKNNGMTAGLLIVLFIGWGIICFLGVKILREKENQFKELIGLFPAEVVLSNFMLKSYIMKICQDKSDSIRDFI